LCANYDCIGVILNENWVLALSCTTPGRTSFIKVIAGDRVLYDEDAEGTEQFRTVVQYVDHPNKT